MTLTMNWILSNLWYSNVCGLAFGSHLWKLARACLVALVRRMPGLSEEDILGLWRLRSLPLANDQGRFFFYSFWLVGLFLHVFNWFSNLSHSEPMPILSDWFSFMLSAFWHHLTSKASWAQEQPIRSSITWREVRAEISGGFFRSFSYWCCMLIDCAGLSWAPEDLQAWTRCPACML